MSNIVHKKIQRGIQKFINPCYILLHKLPYDICGTIRIYYGTLNHKANIIQRAWRRYTYCNPYVSYSDIDNLIGNMYPLTSKFRLLRQSNFGYHKWCCPWQFMCHKKRVPYLALVFCLYRNRLIHYGYGDFNKQQLSIFVNKKKTQHLWYPSIEIETETIEENKYDNVKFEF